MGYARYTLDDGRQGGYAVEAVCDEPACNAEIDRGMAFVCGEVRAGVSGGDEGCGKYFCASHLFMNSVGRTQQLCLDCHDKAMEAARCPRCLGECVGPAGHEDAACEECDNEGVILWTEAAS